MKHLAVLAGFTLYCLAVWAFPKALMVLSGLVVAIFLCAILFTFLSSSPPSSKGGWDAKDSDRRD
ncbi:hypothetical protein ACTOWA_00350 [Herbaspirillum seropedicae]|uniref:hypothetical protein n=1 Tax=Herbaspirillum seropedicae TaxID=964 RepID=UPI00285D6C2C|nr:hypothetical protein [Herbaspirillum seropedicae]MDR6397960.1 hypothetical protein [Herbaspirillum seropedicae]